MKIDKKILHMAAVYAVASEICRRNFNARITTLDRRTYILVHDPNTGKEIRIEVRAKQGREWPAVRGIKDKQNLLVFVDFEGKKDTDRPDFYILDGDDWKDYLNKHVISRRDFQRLDEGYIPVLKTGYKGAIVLPKQVEEHKERWDKLERVLKDD